MNSWEDPCEPTPPRCTVLPASLFKPGISTRPSPICDERYCYLEYCGGGNWRLNSNNTLDRTRWIEGWIITQLLTRGEVSCEEHPLKVRDGGWWADSFRIGGLGFISGSKLWSLNFARANNEALLMAKQYANDALNYLQMWGVIARLEIDAFYISPSTIHLKIKAIGPGVAANAVIEGVAMPNSYGWLWNEYSRREENQRGAQWR